MRRQALRIGVADADAGFGERVRKLLRRRGAEVVVEAAGVPGLVAAAAGAELDVLLVDERLEWAGPALPAPLAVVAATPTLDGLRAAVAAGATGYLARDADADELVRCLSDVAAGVVAVPAGMMAALILGTVDARRPGRGPTRRQEQVAALAANGLSTAQIAQTLGLTAAAVRRHRSERAARLDSAA